MTEAFKMNEDTLAMTSHFFRNTPIHETQPSSSPVHEDERKGSEAEAEAEAEAEKATRTQSSTSPMPSTPVSPDYPVAELDTTPQALFLYCLWVAVHEPLDRLSRYLDSTIPRPSLEFTIYLYEAFLLAVDLKDNTFFNAVVSTILRDADAGQPGEEAIAWVYENTREGHLLRQFVVDCTLTWADDAVDDWRRVASEAPREFVVDVSCRMIEMGLIGGWVKAEVTTKYWNGVSDE
jgi:hypothetical protein